MNEIQPPRRKTSPLSTIRATLEVVTPIYGGSFEPRTIDEIDIIRPATVRGHLRFWWRALYGHAFADSRELYARESEIWGAAGGEGKGGRSQVELRIRLLDRAERQFGSLDDLDPNIAYALFPARAQSDGTPEAPRRSPGSRFEIILNTRHRVPVLHALQAWLLFGGYGGRTRRGLGSLTLQHSDELRLPAQPTETAIDELFGMKLFGVSTRPSDVASLLGARLYVRTERSATAAWQASLSWLRHFRQGADLGPSLRAREPAPSGAKEPYRPSRSNWPEPDKIRRLSSPGSHPWAHDPLHNQQPAWPRAALGLPILGRFQGKNRDRVPWHQATPPRSEPGPFELGWHDGERPRERLASPLIVKPLPLTNQRYAAMALWLCRAQPPGEVVLKGNKKSHAPFDRLVAHGDKPRFSVLAGKATLQDAFFAWLELADPELVKMAASSKPGSNKPNRNKPHGKGSRR